MTTPSLNDLLQPGVHHLIVRHDAFCPLAYGEGSTCATGCNPTVELVTAEEMAATVARDFRNRQQRRAAAKGKGAKR